MDTKNIWNQIICAPALFLSEVVVDVEDEPSVASELILIIVDSQYSLPINLYPQRNSYFPILDSNYC